MVLCAGIGCLYSGIRSFRCSWNVLRLKSCAGFGLWAFSLFFSFGVWRSFGAWRDVQGVVWPEEDRMCHVILTEVPKVGERTVGAEAMWCPDEGMMENRKVQMVFMKDSLSVSLRVGDRLWCRGQVRKLISRGNPEEFDYAEYLSVNGVSGQAFIPSGEWGRLERDVGTDDGLSFWMGLRVEALRLRGRLVELYRGAGLQGEELAFFTALTLGDQSGLSDELKDVYAGVGVSHVLALSGMHLTFLVGMLNVLLLNYCRKRLWHILGIASALLLIWIYTFLAGLPPSLVRATVMYTLMLTGSLMGRSGFSVNSLALAAMLMLCGNPLLLYDVGFQLSFLAMVGILVLCPRYQDLPLMRRPYVGWVFQSLLVSFAAQLFTIPLVAFRFGTFAPYSALATLLVSPVTALLIYGMPVLLCSYLSGFWPEMVARGISFLETCQNGCLRWMAGWPGAVVYTDWSFCFTVLCYIVLGIWLLRPFRYKAMRWKVCMGMMIGLLLAFPVCRWADRPRGEVVFYNNPSCPAVHVIYSPSCSYLFTAGTDCVRERMSYIAESFWRKKLTAAPLWVGGDFRDDTVIARQGLVYVKGGLSFLMLSDGRWEGMAGKKRADVDYLYICRGYRGSLSDIGRLFRPRHVVLDASLWDSDWRRYATECKALGWDIYDMKEEGALRIPLL